MKSLRDKHAEEARCHQAKEEEMRAREDAVRDRDTELGAGEGAGRGARPAGGAGAEGEGEGGRP